MLKEIFDHIPQSSVTKKNAQGSQDQNLREIMKKSKRWHLNMTIVMGVKESKTSPRHLNFLKQLKKTSDMMPLLRVLFLDTPGHPKSALQYSNSSKYNNQKFWHSLRPPFLNFFLSPRGGYGRRNFSIRWILILIAMKLPFLPSVRPMRKCRVGKQNFTQVPPCAK